MSDLLVIDVLAKSGRRSESLPHEYCAILLFTGVSLF